MAVQAQRSEEEVAQPRELSAAESRAAFDRIARRNLGMSGEEFLRKWHAKEFGDDPDSQPRVMRVAMLLDLVR